MKAGGLSSNASTSSSNNIESSYKQPARIMKGMEVKSRKAQLHFGKGKDSNSHPKA
jgi:hypothetical protein